MVKLVAMEVGNKIKRSGTAVVLMGVLALGAGGSKGPETQRSSRPSIGRTAAGHLATHNTVAITVPETVPEPEVPTSTSEPQPSPTTEYAPPTTAPSEAPAAVEAGSKKIRDRVAESLPYKSLVALDVGKKLQSQFPEGLFIKVKKADCGAITEFTPDKGKVRVQNRIFARPYVLSNAHLLDKGAYTGLVGHGDTDAAAALGRYPVITTNPNTASIQGAILKLTATVCSQLAPTPQVPSTRAAAHSSP